MQIIQIDENTWRIEDQGVRFFLLAGTEKALMIDSGMTIANALEIAESLVSLPVELLNTHADGDHVSGNGSFGWFYMHPAEASNYYNSRPRTGNFVPAEEGMQIQLGERTLEIISIPGHTPGSIAILDVEKRVLYSGDSVQDGSIFMFGVQREFHAYLHSMKKLEGMQERFDEIYPSHGTIPVSKTLIGELKRAAEKVLADEVPGEEAEMFGHKICRRDAGCAVFLCEPADVK